MYDIERSSSYISMCKNKLQNVQIMLLACNLRRKSKNLYPYLLVRHKEILEVFIRNQEIVVIYWREIRFRRETFSCIFLIHYGFEP